MMSNKAIIQLTAAAEQHINSMIKPRQQAIGFRLSVKKTGCSGYMYVPEIIEQAKEGDIEIITANGLHVFIDEQCVPMVQGTTLDFVKKTLGMEQLEFQNPNADSLCGCGESFNLKSESSQ